MIKGILSTEWGISAHYHEHADTNAEDIDFYRVVFLVIEDLRSSIDWSHLMSVLQRIRTVFNHAKVD